jgi:transcriptional regulator with XRE-family HTH domain
VDQEKPFYVALGRRIEQYRTANRLTQDQLGTALSPKLTRAAISNIETAKQRVLAHVLADLARALSVSVLDLIETPRHEAAPSDTSALKKSLEAALPREAVDVFTRRIGQRQRVAARRTGQ